MRDFYKPLRIRYYGSVHNIIIGFSEIKKFVTSLMDIYLYIFGDRYKYNVRSMARRPCSFTVYKII